jgi:hypothetical protein
MVFSERFQKKAERTPSQNIEDVYDFAEAKGYRISDLGSDDDFLFHIIDDTAGFNAADKKAHHDFIESFSKTNPHITKENIELIEDAALGCYIRLAMQKE